MFRMQQEYLSATKMDEARLEVHKIRGLFYAKPLKQAISEAMEINGSNHTLLTARIVSCILQGERVCLCK